MIFRKKKIKEKFQGTSEYTPFEDAPDPSPLFDHFTANDGKVIHKWVHYFDIYETYFSRFRNQPVNILEIGVFKGGSLQMWKQYFGKGARIFGVDINPDCKLLEEENIKIFIGDQTDRTFLRNLVSQLPTIDIVLDDGGHFSKQQITTFEELYPHISPTGIYMVEDVHTNYWPHFNKGSKLSFIDYSKKLVDQLHAWHFDETIRGLYAVPHKDRPKKPQTEPFTQQTKAIHFYNGVVVYEKQPIPEPYHCFSTK